MFNKDKKPNYEHTEDVLSSTAPTLSLGIFGKSLQAEYAKCVSDATSSSWSVPPYPSSLSISYADYIQMQNLFSKLEKFLDAQTEKPYKTNLDVIKSFNSKQLAVFVIKDVKKILSGTDSAVEELEAWLNEAPILPE